MIKLPKDKPIRMKLDKWQEVKDLADELSNELNMNVSLPDAIGHAIKFFKERRRMAGTPDGKAAGTMSDIQAPRKEVIS